MNVSPLLIRGDGGERKRKKISEQQTAKEEKEVHQAAAETSHTGPLLFVVESRAHWASLISHWLGLLASAWFICGLRVSDRSCFLDAPWFPTNNHNNNINYNNNININNNNKRRRSSSSSSSKQHPEQRRSFVFIVSADSSTFKCLSLIIGANKVATLPCRASIRLISRAKGRRASLSDCVSWASLFHLSRVRKSSGQDPQLSLSRFKSKAITSMAHKIFLEVIQYDHAIRTWNDCATKYDGETIYGKLGAFGDRVPLRDGESQANPHRNGLCDGVRSVRAEGTRLICRSASWCRATPIETFLLAVEGWLDFPHVCVASLEPISDDRHGNRQVHIPFVTDVLFLDSAPQWPVLPSGEQQLSTFGVLDDGRHSTASSSFVTTADTLNWGAPSNLGDS